MTICMLGKITEIGATNIKVEDLQTGSSIILHLEIGDVFEAKIGDTGIFQGEYINNKIKAKRIDVRKFLNPIFESELISQSGFFNLITPIEDVFTQAFKEKSVSVQQ